VANADKVRQPGFERVVEPPRREPEVQRRIGKSPHVRLAVDLAGYGNRANPGFEGLGRVSEARVGADQIKDRGAKLSWILLLCKMGDRLTEPWRG